MTTATFYRNVMTTSGEESRETAKRITAAVLRALRDRLTPEEADQAAAQLPRELQEIWTEGETQLSPGEAEDVLAQLPKDIKQIWADAQLR